MTTNTKPTREELKKIGETLFDLIKKHGGVVSKDGQTVTFKTKKAETEFMNEWMAS